MVDLREVSTKVLSIQSHTVHGYVGNRAVTFPLQYLNWDVDVLNTVNFSNHTGYGQVFGTETSAEQLLEIYKGLSVIGVEYDAVMSGYTPNKESLKAVGEICSDIKRKYSNAIWLLDPVMGDEGQLYVDESVVPVYKEILQSGKIDIITPNQFEAELIVGYEIVDKSTLRKALDDLHDKFNIDHVVISSFSSELSSKLKLREDDEPSKNVIYTIVSSKSKTQKEKTMYFKVPKLNSYFTGVGDLFSALLLDRVYKYTHQRQNSGKEAQAQILVDSVAEVLTVMSKVLRITQKMIF
ncbi:hypothetical protein PACTADRAFT_48792, partial [Pachysolen tannophilus NRRL Y-2460]